MGLDLTKLEKVKRRGVNIIAQCPACAEAGGDRTGDHLFIDNLGRFGCVLYPGSDGQIHRKKIFELIGIKEIAKKVFEVRKPLSSIESEPIVIQEDVLGHLGHIKSTYAEKSLNINKNKDRIQEDLNRSVPSDPKSILDL